ncbi:MAG: CAP domain-containing protein, partial [Planctomycetota bacterium]|nr:CAP domain-containing protein [Planctomycetota bacterium]
MLTQQKKEQRIVCSTRGLPEVACLLLVLLAMLVSAGQAAAAGKAEYGLVKLINQYRQQKGLPAIPLSQKLTTVAITHAEDLENKEPHKKLCTGSDPYKYMHSWSHNPGKWKGGCYINGNQATYKIMHDKPYEITGYPSDGYEIVHLGTSTTGAMQSWKTSIDGHNDVILNKKVWAGYPWKAIGAASYKGYYVVWFGTKLDKSKAPNKILYLKDYDKHKTAGLMDYLIHIDPSKIKLLKAASGSSGKGKESKVAPSGSRVSAGAHGRVYALNKSGIIIGNVPGATIELKNQGGGVAATVKSGQQGYYKADLSPGQYF